jgi:hypothetical protein
MYRNQMIYDTLYKDVCIQYNKIYLELERLKHKL